MTVITARNNAIDSIAVSGRDGVRRVEGSVLVPLTGRIKVKMETVKEM